MRFQLRTGVDLTVHHEYDLWLREDLYTKGTVTAHTTHIGFTVM